MNSLWRIELFGGLVVCRGDEKITRFATQKTASLLAYLAFYRQRLHPREALIELLWPECELDAGRNRLSTLLSYLRHLLEPPGIEAGSVVLADRASLRLNPDAVLTDVAEFERLLQQAARTEAGSGRLLLLERAVALYRGELLPGSYEEWIGSEQSRLNDRFAEALQALGLAYEQAGEIEAALASIERAIRIDPCREATHRTRMRLQAALGRPAAVKESYQELERLFREELGASPSAATRELAERLQRSPQTPHPEPETLPVPTALPSREAVAEAPPGETGTLSATPAPPTLPFQMTRFFGRAPELVELPRIFQETDARLVTITGTGGAGKTRLAVEVALKLAPSLQNRVWYVPLAELPDARLLPYALSRALHVSVTDTADPLEAVLSVLKEGPCLLVLDNFEHLIRNATDAAKGDQVRMDTGTALIRLLLERAPQMRCLVTSQRALHLSGEQDYPLDPLPLPPLVAPPESALTAPSVSLYVDRAKLARPDFALTANNVETVVRLCHKLEGIPLAIEMAAAWAKVLPPAKMLERLEERLDMLTNRRRDVPARHLSLRATLDWSYDLLDAPQQRLLTCLAVFRGGWTLEAAEAIGGEEGRILTEETGPVGPGDVLDLLTDLVEKSLVVYREREDEGRYRLLETVRQYSRDRLKQSGEEPKVQARHFTYFRDMAAASWGHIRGSEQIVWLDRLEREHENMRAALAWASTEEGRQQVGLEAELDLAGQLLPLWHMRGYWREGRQRLEAALARETESRPTEIRSRALHGVGVLAEHMGDAGTAKIHYEACLVQRRQLSDIRGISSVAMGLGNLASRARDFAAAHRWYDESLAAAQALEDRWFMGAIYNNLGNLAGVENDVVAEQHCFQEALKLHRITGNAQGIATTQLNLSIVYTRQQDFSAAYVALQESLPLLQQLGDKGVTVHALAHLAQMELRQARPRQAAVLLGATQHLMEEIGVLPDEQFLGYLKEAQQMLEADAFQSALAQGRAMEAQQSLNEALNILHHSSFRGGDILQ